jgi:hypothetical protein
LSKSFPKSSRPSFFSDQVILRPAHRSKRPMLILSRGEQGHHFQPSQSWLAWSSSRGLLPRDRWAPTARSPSSSSTSTSSPPQLDRKQDQLPPRRSTRRDGVRREEPKDESEKSRRPGAARMMNAADPHHRPERAPAPRRCRRSAPTTRAARGALLGS